MVSVITLEKTIMTPACHYTDLPEINIYGYSKTYTTKEKWQFLGKTFLPHNIKTRF